MAYPPGIPIIIPGERITREILDYIKDMKSAKLQLQGMEDSELTTINIIEENSIVSRMILLSGCQGYLFWS